MANLTQVKIYPAIGIARIGNSPEWYVGPEIPYPAAPPVPSDGQYKDTQCRIRRQAQRFRLFGFYDDNSVKELTQTDGPITWTVHVANTKMKPTEMTSIDPGARTLTGIGASATFDGGTYQGVAVPLGEAHVDDDGNLIVVGGYGFSSSPSSQPLTTYLNNAGWHDDVADGPVDATIVVGGTTYDAVGAWVICPPPRFAPPVQTPTTLYDALRDVAITNGMLPAPGAAGYPAVSFVNDIWPVLRRGIGATRVAAAAFGPGDHDTLSAVIPPGPGQDATRQAIYAKLRPGGDMPLLNGTSQLKDFQHYNMQQWAAGTFVNDWPAATPSLTPDGMTLAALENCVGAAFFPGIEATSTISGFPYTEPFRFDHTGMNPGDVTQMMARPWQADFTACSGGSAPDQSAWWPAARPDSVYPEATPATAADWTRGLVTSYADMVANWFRLGFIVDPGDGKPVETERHVTCRDCWFIIDRSTYGKAEIQALLQLSSPADVAAAFYVVVEGFTPSQLGITTATPSPSQLAAWAPTITASPSVTDMGWTPTSLLCEDPSLPNAPQRFTFVYDMTFASTNGFVAELQVVELTASIQDVERSGAIELVDQPNPYFVDGAVTWLSTDLRVFQITPGQSLPGVPAVTMGTTPADASTFIKNLIAALTAAGPVGNPFDGISTDEQTSWLELSETVGGVAVFNFAVCRVRYRALALNAPNVRAFFRTFQTAATYTDYDQATTYRRGGLTGVEIPLLGIMGGDLVTIPFFAEPRVDSSALSLNAQTDPANVQTIPPDASGNEVDAFFGCWLDINQPSQAQFPVQPAPQDGPWTAGRQPIQQLVRGLHQCLVAEIAFDPDPIPPGATTGTSDKLAQRNLAIVESDNPGSVASHTIQHTFEMRPTRTTLQPNEKPDELMIVWGSTPRGSVATLYLPGVRTAEILNWAGRMYETTLLERVDDHTLRMRTGEVTYIPIPSGTGPSFAGLLTVELPPDVRHGNVFTIVVRQITTEKIVIRPPVPREQMRALLASTRAGAAEANAVSRMNRGTFAASERPPLQERRVVGSFQITVPVRSRKEIVGREERALTVVRSILRAMPRENRWYLAFERYVEQIAQRVEALGGNAGGGPPDRGGHGDGGGSDHRGCIGLLFDLLFGRRGRR
jgi:L-Lysine epsilon oxidase N-terminal/L-lysine epsilon oxidase C-terminal domain